MKLSDTTNPSNKNEIADMASTTCCSLTEMAETYRISSWKDFEDVYEKHFRRNRGRFYYRGQRDSSWELRTTHERLLQQLAPNIPYDKPYPSYAPGKFASTPGSRIELLALRAFQARSSKFISNPPPLEDTLEWLAMMRHWGLSTRLIDVTTSPYVALYFALSDHLLVPKIDDTIDPAVWAINHIPLRHAASKATGLPDHTDLSNSILFHEHLIHSSKAMLVPVHPHSHNERLSAQQGTFLCVGNPDLPLYTNLLTCMPNMEVKTQSVLHKLVIDHKVAIDILGRLTTMNIHSASLFPDLQGYARFIENSLVLFSKPSSNYGPNTDFESLERLGWLG